MKVGIIYGSDTGVTEDATKVLSDIIEYQYEILRVDEVDESDFTRFDLLILGLSTWYDGDLQSDWEDYFETFKTIDFTGKTVALFGLGDQHGYDEFFIDGVGMLAEVVLKNGGRIIGHWSTEGYEFTKSKALKDENTFYGLALDEDNQAELTDERIETWWGKLKEEMGD